MLALALLLVDPDELLRRLSVDDIEVRQAAAAGLSRPELLDLRGRTEDVEIRGRLDDLLRRLEIEERIRFFGGGKRVSGFGLSLRSERFYGRGPFRLTVEVMNVGPSPQVFPGLGVWDLERPDEETRVQGADAKLSLRKVFGGGLRRTRFGPASGGEKAPAVLRRGESIAYTYVLDTKGLPAGDYDVQVEYLALGEEGPLRSNRVRLMIR